MPKIDGSNEEQEMTDFSLGEIQVFPTIQRVMVSGKETRLEPRVMDLLAYFASNPNKVLTKEKILADVWGGTNVVEEALQRAISILRKTLGDDRENPVYIETISKKGYRLLIQPKPLEKNEKAEVDLTKKNIKVSPLLLLAGAAVIALLAYLSLGNRSQEQAYVPQANESDDPLSSEKAPYAPEAVPPDATGSPEEAPPAPKDEGPEPPEN